MASSEDYAALAAAQAMWKALGKVVSTKEPTSLRSRMDAELRQLWMEKRIFGKIPLVIGGHVVGMLTAKQAPKRHHRDITVDDPHELMEGEKDGWEDFIYENIDQFAEWVLAQGVARPAGCTVSEWDDHGGWGGTMITGCKPDEVIPLLRGELPPAIALAIEGEVE